MECKKTDCEWAKFQTVYIHIYIFVSKREKPDIVFIQESWLKPGWKLSIATLRIGHSILNFTLHITGKHPTSLCEHCQVGQIMEHYACYCRRYTVSQRKDTWEEIKRLGLTGLKSRVAVRLKCWWTSTLWHVLEKNKDAVAGGYCTTSLCPVYCFIIKTAQLGEPKTLCDIGGSG